MGLPKIYIFSGHPTGGDGPCFALAEDGVGLGSHWCSHEGYARGDLGMVEGVRQDRRDFYALHYPGGYEFEFVPASEVKAHAGIAAAMEKNRAMAAAEDAAGEASDA